MSATNTGTLWKVGAPVRHGGLWRCGDLVDRSGGPGAGRGLFRGHGGNGRRCRSSCVWGHETEVVREAWFDPAPSPSSYLSPPVEVGCSGRKRRLQKRSTFPVPEGVGWGSGRGARGLVGGPGDPVRD